MSASTYSEPRSTMPARTAQHQPRSDGTPTSEAGDSAATPHQRQTSEMSADANKERGRVYLACRQWYVLLILHRRALVNRLGALYFIVVLAKSSAMAPIRYVRHA